jgi:hypothetical protein
MFNDALEKHVASIFFAEGGITSVQKQVIYEDAMGTSDLIKLFFFGGGGVDIGWTMILLLLLLFCVCACVIHLGFPVELSCSSSGA